MKDYDIDKAVQSLCESVRDDLLRRAEKARHRALLKASKELDLKPGTKLGATASMLERLTPGQIRRFQRNIGIQLLIHAAWTRVGYALCRVAESEGKDPLAELARIVRRGANAVKKMETPTRKAKKKQKAATVKARSAKVKAKRKGK